MTLKRAVSIACYSIVLVACVASFAHRIHVLILAYELNATMVIVGSVPVLLFLCGGAYWAYIKLRSFL